MHPDDHHNRPWSTLAAHGPVSARVRPPASKSITNRALVLAALSDGPASVANPLHARDTLLAASALRALGTRITETASPVAWHLTPGQPPTGAEVSVDVGNAGTVMRFLPGVAALTSAAVHFDGDARARQRPVGPILAALRQLGADIDDGGRAAVPFTVHGRGAIRGGTVTLNASGSSQLVSGLLLTAPRSEEGVEIRHEGPPVPSAPHIAMTVRMLRAAGAEVTETVAGGERPAGRIPGGCGRDGSTSGPSRWNPTCRTRARSWPRRWSPAAPSRCPTGPGTACRRPGRSWTCWCLWARYEVGSDGLTITGTGRVRGITADLRDVSELAPVLTAAAALADSPSVFTGLAHTRSHETDRLAALAKEINALGGDITELPDGLQIRPRPLRAGAADTPFGSYDDHRMVMAAAVLGLAVPGIVVDNAQTVAKTFPGFTDVWAEMLDRATEPARARRGPYVPGSPRPRLPAAHRRAPRTKRDTGLRAQRDRQVPLHDRRRLVVAMKPRGLGKGSVVVGDRVAGRRRLGGGGIAGADVRVEPRTSALRRSADDTTRKNGSSSRTPTRCDRQRARRTSAQLGFVDRFLVAAYNAGLDPLLVLTKADLASPRKARAYTPLGLPMLTTRRPLPLRTLSRLRTALTGRISVFIGPSGVGKSTLMNTLVPAAARTTGLVNPVTRRAARLVFGGGAPLGDGWLIDTRGYAGSGWAT